YTKATELWGEDVLTKPQPVPAVSKSTKKAEGNSIFSWLIVLALLGAWMSVAVVWFDLVDYKNVVGTFGGVYDADGDGDFDVEDAKVLLGLPGCCKRGASEHNTSTDALANELSDWLKSFQAFFCDALVLCEAGEDGESVVEEEMGAENTPVTTKKKATSRKAENPKEDAPERRREHSTREIGQKLKVALKEQLRMIHEKIEAKKIAKLALAEVRTILAREEEEKQAILAAKKAKEEAEAKLREEEERKEQEERLAREKEAKEKAEQERLAREKTEKEKAEKERIAKEKAEKEKAERERLAREQAEKERAEKLAKEKAEKERAERERIAKEQEEKEKAEKERIAREKAEKERAEKERLAKEQAEKERAEKERLAKEKAEKERAEKERLAKEQAEKERLAKEQAEKERAEKERLAKEQAEKERAEKERLAKEKAEKERAEKERLAKEQAEKERAVKERLAKEQAEKERAEKERVAKEKAEKERLEKERAEKERLEKERLAKAEKEKAEKERAEKERLAKEKAEKERLAKEKAEKERAEKERLAKEKAEKERAEKERLAKEKAEKERAEKERLAKEKAEKERAEKERLAKEKAEKERAEKERLAKEKAEKERAEKERLAKEKAEKERAEKERLAKEKAEKEKVEKERLAKEKAEKEREEKERLAKEKVEKEREEKERLAKEKVEKEREEKERLAKEKAEKERAENERLAKEKAEKERAEKEKLAKEKAEKERAEKERLAKEKAEKERAEKERLAKEKAEKRKAEKEKLEKEKAEKERLEKETQAKEKEEKIERLKEKKDEKNGKEEKISTRGLKEKAVTVETRDAPITREDASVNQKTEAVPAGESQKETESEVRGEGPESVHASVHEGIAAKSAFKMYNCSFHFLFADSLENIDSTGELVVEALPEKTLDSTPEATPENKPPSEKTPEPEPIAESVSLPDTTEDATSKTDAPQAFSEPTPGHESTPEVTADTEVKKKKPKFFNKFDKTIKAEINSAEKLRKKGKAEEALRAFEALVQKYPQSPRSRYGKAQAEDDMAEKLRSNDMLLKAVNTYKEAADLPDAPEDLIKATLKRRADRQQFLGRTRGSLATLEKLVQIFPEDISLKNDLGVAHLLIGDNTGAKQLYEEVLALAPDDGFAKVHYGFILKSENKIAESIPYLRDGLKSGAPGTDDGRFYFHLGDALQRMGDMNEAYDWYETGYQHGHFASVWQRSLYNMPGLRAQPWWTAKETGYTDLVRVLERNWMTIRDEALAVLDTKSGLFLPEDENLRETGNWGQFTLWQQGNTHAGHMCIILTNHFSSAGRKVGSSCQSVPKTCAFLERYPEATTCKRGQIKFSVMQPGTHVWPHTGPTNCRLRMHLGLVIPRPGCRIRCTNQTRTWEEGKVLIFDDSFEHEVWQEADSYRLIFIVDVWHPELSQSQRNALSPI
ncbi:hypothetical protein NFI96_028306, partial [Prochilodus magdalenae]